MAVFENNDNNNPMSSIHGVIDEIGNKSSIHGVIDEISNKSSIHEVIDEISNKVNLDDTAGQEEKTKISPWNQNNKLINKYQLEAILQAHGVQTPVTHLEYYYESFSHKSYCVKSNLDDDLVMADKPESCLELRKCSNERLEFLGDSIIGAVVAHYLYERYPEQDEGFMTRLKIKLVNGETLAFFSKLIHLDEYILLSRHVEDRCNGRNSTNILEDCFEAFIGAIYLDFSNHYTFDWIINYVEALEKRVAFLESQYVSKEDDTTFKYKDIRRSMMRNCLYGPGYNVAQTFLIHVIEKYIDFADLIISNTNYKDILMRYFQRTYQITPTYKMISQEGQHQEKVFRVSVLDKDGNILEIGEGPTKKKAQQDASKKALINYGLIEE